jgi:hypothetical protein|nr:MAG TPA: hypothetical protein [Bacteriophage sp.]
MIAETLKRLFCKHEWELKHCIAIHEKDSKFPVGYKDVYVCKKCLKKHAIKY